MNQQKSVHAPSFQLPAVTACLADELAGSRARDLLWPIGMLVLLVGVPMALIEYYAGPAIYPVAVPAYPFFPFLGIFGLLVLGPAMDAVLMRFIFHVLGRHVGTTQTLHLVGSLLWLALHLPSAKEGLQAGWSFYVLGACFLRLHLRSPNRAYGLVILIHALANLVAYGPQLAAL